MELSKNYIPGTTEEKWNSHWKTKQYFNSKPDGRKSFTVVIPPPNVTGVLHMGHTLNETVQDILVRKARMTGFNACWVPGSDHASIATEAKVVQMLKEKGIDKNNLSREEFLKYAFEWKEKYGNIIYSQIEKLGCSVDWSRVNFTMDDHYYKAVIKVFVDLYSKGLIYRGARMINWDPSAKTALSDEEVEYKDLQGTLYYLRYKVVDENGNAFSNTPSGDVGITIATQRPETIMGDTAICVNPNDQRYAHLKGAYAFVPLINRRIPIIFDEYVDPVFGTGALKVTPAHDINDYNLGLKHNLEVVDTLNADGTLSEAAQIYIGEDRFVARKKIIAELKEKDFLLKEEEYQTRLGYSQRSGAVVEPRISTQWFVKMKELAEPALKEVVEGNIKIHPGDKFLATYKYWLENVKDWCISRQLWWGQQIPAWYDEQGNCYVAESVEELHSLQPSTVNHELKRDEDVLDTWFSSWLWPIEVFNGITQPDNEEINYYYPTAVLVTGQDIIFFWVARMIMAGMQFKNEKPFSDVYFTGMVRDKQGRKMSKSLGNSPDLLELIDKYGADAVRFGIMISSPAGNDLLFDEAALEQGRNFNNKMWNALKLVKMWEDRQLPATDNVELITGNFAITWFENRLNEARVEVDNLMQQFKLSEALKTVYSLIWDDFCGSYLEWIKPALNQRKIYDNTNFFFEELLQLLHPFMPFITEEIYHLLKVRNEGDDLSIRQTSAIAKESVIKQIIENGDELKNAIKSVTVSKAESNLKKTDSTTYWIKTEKQSQYQSFLPILAQQTGSIFGGFVDSPPPNSSIYGIIDSSVIYGSPTGGAELAIKENAEEIKESRRKKLVEDLQHQKGFLESVTKKLSNERFVQNAKPEVIALERKKQADAEARIKTIEESLANLG